MLLFEISQETTTRTFISIINDYVSTSHQITQSVEKFLIDTPDIKQAKRLIAARESTWYGKHHFDIINCAHQLKSVSPGFDKISKITLSALRSDSLETTELTKRNGLDKFLMELMPILKSLKADVQIDQLKQIQAERSRLYNNLNTKKPTVTSPISAPSTKIDLTDQSRAADAMIQQVISTLPKDQQNAARQYIQRADNKLKALQMFMNQNQ